MSYTNVWSDTNPTGAEAANTIDDIFRSVKVDIEQRFVDIFALPSFATDPLRPYGVRFTDATDAKLFLGASKSLLVRDKADSATYFTINATVSASAVPFNVTASGGLAVGTIAGRRRITSTSATAFELLTDSDVAADLLVAGLTAATGLFTDGTVPANNAYAPANVLAHIISKASALTSGAAVTAEVYHKQTAANTAGSIISHFAYIDSAHTSGTSNMHIASVASVEATGNGGTTTTLSAYRTQALIGTGHTVTNLTLIDIRSPANSGTITNLIGLNIANITAGGTSNISLKTGLGKVQFGDIVVLGDQTATLVDGAIWFDGSNYKGRIGGVTKTFTVT